MTYLYEDLKAPTRLYIKQCSHCHLKYFGKSSQKDLHNYRGSGIYWTKHLDRHNASSKHLWNSEWYYDTSIIRFAKKFSAINNIVESNEWANLRIEDGMDGGDTSQTPNFIKSLSSRPSKRGLSYDQIYGPEKAKQLRHKRSISNSKRWQNEAFRETTAKKISTSRKQKIESGHITVWNKGKKVVNIAHEQKVEAIRKDFQQSGLSRRQYSKNRGINYNTLKKYLRGL